MGPHGLSVSKYTLGNCAAFVQAKRCLRNKQLWKFFNFKQEVLYRIFKILLFQQLQATLDARVKLTLALSFYVGISQQQLMYSWGEGDGDNDLPPPTPPTLWKYNRHITLCKFKVYSSIPLKLLMAP